eukprot:5054434-Karenia_brevis.AAC.1
MYLNDFEDVQWKELTKMFRGRPNNHVQRKELQRCSEEGVTKMFRGRINEDAQRKDQQRCSEEGVTKMFRGSRRA